MDLKALDTKTKANDGVWIEILDPSTGENFGLRWKVAGLDSDLYADFSKRMIANAKLKKKAGDKDDDVDYDVEMLAELSLDWEDTEDKKLTQGIIMYDGKEIKFSKENAKLVLSGIPVIKRQVNQQVMRVQNFLSGRSTG